MRIEQYIARAWALRIRRSLIKRAMRQLEQITAELSGKDAGLRSIWEEICVQVRGEESMFWSAYVETIDSILMPQIETLERDEQLALWVMTDSGWDYVYNHHADKSGSDSDIPVDLTEIVDMVRSELMTEAAN